MPTALVLRPPQSGKRLPGGVYVDRLIEARELRGFSRRQAAVRAGIALEQLRAAERGEADLELDAISQVCRALDCPLGFLLRPPAPGALFTAIRMCGPGIHPCSRCDGVADYLCDFPLGTGRTCDLQLCEGHRHRVEGELDEPDDPDAIDYCPQHAAMAAAKEREGEAMERSDD